MNNGIKGNIYYSPEYGGYSLRIIKKENGKNYVPIISTIQWQEHFEGSLINPITFSEFTDGRSENEKGNLYGENLALKDEVKFLREQIAMLLGRI